MRQSTLLKVIAPTLLLFSTQTLALPFQSIDPRSLGMGGVGVASGTSANASFMNPALLAAAYEDEDFSLEFLGGVRIQDPGGLIDEVDNYQNNDLESQLTDSINRFNQINSNPITSPQQLAESARAVEDAANIILDQLNKFTNKPLQGEAFGGMVIGIPSKKMGTALAVNAYLIGGGKVNFTNADNDLVQSVIDDAVATADGSRPDALITNDVVADQISGASNVVDNLTSNVESRGAAIVEIGLSLAREVNIGGHGVAIGITPKYVALETFDYRVDVNTAEFDANKGLREFNDFNFDMGLARDFGNGWKAGLVAKNLLSKKYKTVQGNTIKINPQVRLGVSRRNDWLTLAADMDLMENDPAGFESKSQYLGLGAELDLFDWVQLRAGYRHNLSDSDSSIPTLGFGFSPFGVHADLALAGNATDLAISFQLGFRF